MNVTLYTTFTAEQAIQSDVTYAVSARSVNSKTILRQRRPITPRA